MNSEWTSNYNLLMFDEIDSTNDEAKRLARSQPIGNFVISAKKQTKGRGQYGREWDSSGSNLYMSILLQPDLPREIFSQCSFLSALSLYDVIHNLAKKQGIELNMSLKWPNDLLINEAKIAGILLESIGPYLIIGIGLNIEHHPVIQGRNTTSMKALGLACVTPQNMIDLIMQAFEGYYKTWLSKGFMPVRKLWLLRAHKLGSIITANDGKQRISGEFVDIDQMGAIRLKLANGAMHSMSAGEVLID
jgi:BirA family biotin operon repressor/biotin-[acetyl-CoA-carboxylase] ligase